MEDPLHSWPVVLAFFERCVAVVATLHAVLHKRETPTVIGWVGLIWLSPFVGSILYFGFGINRIARKGQRIQRGQDRMFAAQLARGRFMDESAGAGLPFGGRLGDVVSHVTGKPLLSGNSVIPLPGGEEAYPEMIAAIDQAQKSVALCSYIFDNDRAGREFVEALHRAQQRGVQVRVLVDDVGARYSKPSIVRELTSRSIPCSTFLPTLVPRFLYYANLRSHRKLMVVDGEFGFTGGMNIREGCRGDWQTAHQVQDLHFRVEGPVVSHLTETFVTDWAFVTNEKLTGDTWFSPPLRAGDVKARGISDGPDTDFDNIRLVILGALAVAQKSVDVVTPYFLPDDAVISALNVADMRGVRVRIVVPLENNIKMVQWASSDPLMKVLERGCEVYQTLPPFDHTKLLLVDNFWTLIGSSNWDPRSLRLNFEFNVECYSEELTSRLTRIVETKIATAERLTLTDLQARRLHIRIRDGLARMAIPYL